MENNNYRNLNEFLKFHKTDNKNEITHTSIGSKEENIFPGKYCILDEKMNIFYKLYHKHVFIDNKPAYLTEVQMKSNSGPLLVDIDFRYNTDIDERLHCEEHIIDIIDIYLTEIKSLLNIQQNKYFNVYVLEKPNINKLDDKTKDGIHLIFDLKMDHILQIMLRKKVLENIGNVLEDLPLTNNYDDVLDKGISEGFTNWQMYGSRKPKNEAYELKYIFKCNYDENNETNIMKNDDYDINNLSSEDHLKLLKNMSARNTEHLYFTIKKEIKEEYNEYKENKKNKKKISSNTHQNKVLNITSENFAFNLNEIKTQEILDGLIQLMLDGLTHDEYFIRETHNYTMALPNHYCDDYHLWIRVGWALHNCHFKLFLTWMKFSSKSTKFNFDDIPGYYDTWNNMKDEGLSEKSIMYWLRTEDKKTYDKIKYETIDYYIMKTEKCQAEWEIANVLYQMYKAEFRCAEPKNKLWYQFKNHRWIEVPRGNSLRYNISKELSKLYGQKAAHYINYSVECGQVYGPEKQEEQRAISNKYAAISTDLKRTNYKENIMKEAAEIFYENDEDFLKKLDQNRNLLCFNNGVFDFDKCEFRNGMPEDYITKTTGINYIPFDIKNQQHVKYKEEIEEFMCQLFPDTELREYMWEHLASTLIGTNKNQTFNIYNGCGRNGKSKLVELMSMILGEYKGTVPITLVTNNRGGVGSLSPEIAKLNGIRYAVMQEPSKNSQINDGVMKELTGEDPITGRALYKDSITFVPQFKLVVCTNNLFDIKSNDDGTWRRIRLCEFKSKFVDQPNPTPESPHEFKVDRDITEKFKKWKTIFISLLVDIACKTKGIVKDCDMVLSASNEYRKGQDYLMEFYQEKIIKTNNPKDSIRKTQVHDEFKQWYQDSYGKGIPKGKELYEFLDKKLLFNKAKNRWIGCVIREDNNDEEDSDEDSDNKSVFIHD